MGSLSSIPRNVFLQSSTSGPVPASAVQFQPQRSSLDRPIPGRESPFWRLGVVRNGMHDQYEHDCAPAVVVTPPRSTTATPTRTAHHYPLYVTTRHAAQRTGNVANQRSSTRPPAVCGHHTAQHKTLVTKPTGCTAPRPLAMKPTSDDAPSVSPWEQAQRSTLRIPQKFLVIFNSEECPPQLKDATHISAKGFSIFVHHHQQYSRIPCFQCFDPSHPKSKCTRAPEDRQMQFHRDFEPEIKQAKEMSKFELQHMSLEVRQKCIGNLSNSLGKVMASLKTKATEKALLSEMPQPTDSNSSTGSAAVAAAANSATDVQSVTPSEAEWFDPANLKKQKGAMKSMTSTSATIPVNSSPASKGQPHPASDAASAGRRAPKGGILKAAPKLTSVFGTSPGTVASSGSIGTGSPETSIKASNGQSNRKALQARKKRELELEAILAGKLSSADSVLDGVRANSTQAKQKVAIDARLSTAQATLGNAKEHLSKASSAHSFALDRDELKEPDTSGRDEESSSVNHEAGQFQRQIELLDLQQCVAAKEAAAALLILQEAKNVNNRAEK
ncbi:hypothetical protein FI667_g6338, partial [Globisporangium splendens]